MMLASWSSLTSISFSVPSILVEVVFSSMLILQDVICYRLICSFRLALQDMRETGLVTAKLREGTLLVHGMSGLLGVVSCAVGLLEAAIAIDAVKHIVVTLNLVVAVAFSFGIVFFSCKVFRASVKARHVFKRAWSELPASPAKPSVLDASLVTRHRSDIRFSNDRFPGYMDSRRLFATLLGFPVKPMNPVYIKRDIPYVCVDGEEKYLDWFSSFKQNRIAPTILYFHGGGWIGADKSISSLPTLFQVASHMGWNVLTVNYRLDVTTVKWPGRLHDCLRSLAWARENATGDAPLVVMGDSAGGHLACLVGLLCSVREMWPSDLEREKPNLKDLLKVDAIVDLYGFGHDLRDNRNVFSSAGYNLREYAKWVFLHDANTMPSAPDDDMEVGSPAGTNNVLGEASPMSWIERATAGFKIPPFLLIHGTNDKAVPIVDVQLFYETLQEARRRGCTACVPDVYIEVPGMLHGYNYFWSPATFATNDYLDAYLDCLCEALGY